MGLLSSLLAGSDEQRLEELKNFSKYLEGIQPVQKLAITGAVVQNAAIEMKTNLPSQSALIKIKSVITSRSSSLCWQSLSAYNSHGAGRRHHEHS